MKLRPFLLAALALAAAQPSAAAVSPSERPQLFVRGGAFPNAAYGLPQECNHPLRTVLDIRLPTASRRSPFSPVSRAWPPTKRAPLSTPTALRGFAGTFHQHGPSAPPPPPRPTAAPSPAESPSHWSRYVRTSAFVSRPHARPATACANSARMPTWRICRTLLDERPLTCRTSDLLYDNIFPPTHLLYG